MTELVFHLLKVVKVVLLALFVSIDNEVGISPVGNNYEIGASSLGITKLFASSADGNGRARVLPLVHMKGWYSTCWE